MLLAEIAAYLESVGSLGLVYTGVGTPNLFDVPFPDFAPDVAVALVEVPGDETVRTFGGSLAVQGPERPSFNVHVRGAKEGATAARLLAEKIKNVLDGLGPVTLSGVEYLDVRAAYPPVGPKHDKNERPEYLIRFDVHKGRSAA